MPQSSQLKHYIELHLVVILLGFTAIFGKLVTLSVEHLIFYRTLIAALGLLCVLFFQHHTKALAPITIVQLLGTGTIVGLHWLLFFLAARISNVAVSLVGIATAPLWIALMAPLINQQKLRIVEIFFGLLVLVGLYVIFLTEINHGLGLLISVGAGFLQAIFSIINSRLVKNHPTVSISFYEMLGACLASLGYILWQKNTPVVPAVQDWPWLLLLGLACSVYAFTAVVRLLKHIPAFSVNLAINLEPIYGIVLAYFVFGQSEHMSSGFYAGAIIILVAVFGYQISQRFETFR